MRHAAHLVLDSEQVPAVLEIDDVLEAVLVLVVFLRDQVALEQPAIGPRKIGDVDLDVVAVILALLGCGLAELQILVLADLGAGHHAVAVL